MKATGSVTDLSWQRRCLARAKAGDRAALAELYRAFAPALYQQVLMPKLGDAQAAEDALSETFRSFIEHLQQIEVDDRSLMAWLSRVASNKAHDMHRHRARSRRALTSFESLLAPLRDERGAADGLEAADTRRHAQRVVSAVLSGLHPRYRRAIELRFLEEQPRERCAALMDVRLGTFDVLLLRALRAFRRAWEAHLGPEASAGGAPPGGGVGERLS